MARGTSGFKQNKVKTRCTFGNRVSMVTCLASLMFWNSPTSAQDLPLHGTNGFEFSSLYSEPLFECVNGLRVEGAEISTCVGLVEDLCLSDSVSTTHNLGCLLEEQFAWTDLLRATIPDLIGVAEGKTMISSEDYAAELSERFPRLREKCFSYSSDRIEEANRCQVDAAFQDVKWHFDLYDNGR